MSVLIFIVLQMEVMDPLETVMHEDGQIAFEMAGRSTKRTPRITSIHVIKPVIEVYYIIDIQDFSIILPFRIKIKYNYTVFTIQNNTIFSARLSICQVLKQRDYKVLNTSMEIFHVLSNFCPYL